MSKALGLIVVLISILVMVITIAAYFNGKNLLGISALFLAVGLVGSKLLISPPLLVSRTNNTLRFYDGGIFKNSLLLEANKDDLVIRRVCTVRVSNGQCKFLEIEFTTPPVISEKSRKHFDNYLKFSELKNHPANFVYIPIQWHSGKEHEFLKIGL